MCGAIYNFIFHTIFRLPKLIEDIYLLAKFSHDIKNILYRGSMEELQIHIKVNVDEFTNKFISKYEYQIDGVKYPEETRFYSQFRCSNGKFRTDEYIEEYKQVVGILEKKMNKGQFLTVNRETTAEEFLKQIDPDYAIKYVHYDLDKELGTNNQQKKPKAKI